MNSCSMEQDEDESPESIPDIEVSLIFLIAIKKMIQ